MKTTNYLRTIITVIMCTVFFSQGHAQEEGWTELFNGKDLQGWEQHGGKAKYRVEEGCIVGQAVPDSPNSFLCTQEEFGDFILEFDVLLEDNELNSGVQFRSQVAPHPLTFWFRNQDGEYRPNTIPKDRVYGYQVEIATGGAGGVYDEARRAMLPWWPKKDTPEGKVFKEKEWNTYRVECKGDAIKTIVNGTVVNDFSDALGMKGIIGLQVHDVGKDQTPYQVRWKNIRIKVLD
jgi:hypothetical protein